MIVLKLHVLDRWFHDIPEDSGCVSFIILTDLLEPPNELIVSLHKRLYTIANNILSPAAAAATYPLHQPLGGKFPKGCPCPQQNIIMSAYTSIGNNIKSNDTRVLLIHYHEVIHHYTSSKTYQR